MANMASSGNLELQTSSFICVIGIITGASSQDGFVVFLKDCYKLLNSQSIIETQTCASPG